MRVSCVSLTLKPDLDQEAKGELGGKSQIVLGLGPAVAPGGHEPARKVKKRRRNGKEEKKREAKREEANGRKRKERREEEKEIA